jgi:serine/threonine protein kinase
MNHILTGLCFTHDHGQVHGNINLQNSIILSELTNSTVLCSKQSAWWKPTDFGLVFRETMMELVSTEASHETTGDSSTEKMGIWSLGCVLLELSIGMPPPDSILNRKSMSVAIIFTTGFNKKSRPVLEIWIQQMLHPVQNRPASRTLLDRLRANQVV